MKAGELVNLSPKEQHKYIDKCFSKALLKRALCASDSETKLR